MAHLMLAQGLCSKVRGFLKPVMYREDTFTFDLRIFSKANKK